MKQSEDNFKILKRYLRVYIKMATNSFVVWLARRSAFIIFLIGKIVRYSFYFGFLIFLVKSTNGFAGYTGNQILFFTATYVLIDTLAQFLFRSVYSFRQLVVSGDLDLVLVKPINPLFRSLFGGADPVDLITLPAIIFVVVYIGSLLSPTLLHTTYYILLVINGLVISASFHIAVLSLGIITMEIDHTVMIYRDLVSMGRLPIDIYKEPFKSLLTFIVPVGVMVTIPAKALIGLVGPVGVVSSLIFGLALLFFSIKFWHYALKKYTSASS
ncbi:MAG: hypothetical protein UR39_C0003G0142 [Candidatus Woesebacteria bacterium GW2011_GWA1_33_30]|uniref:Uncharacterized protein n=1 Tax=Candidatus Woesebacteria bacterium GW2011_GWA2_33_28 TaxID=1618561 RepID=A0A0G0C989_9BACT|nr:MAG: hypothetical protein UR38_C0003G0145 [Candidatus Woesebacteria bacterium GW2011_GWA2_33_28]KKP48607.1 MAG: hypothetical protein UR39_C0003G0142 [Candidatus Woesebacteria bacterium GW2011_GWA1_33_30]KKP49746.1 MAG: hypothetical protein UR40_C0004G0145 [Microgenomates group bacterium GW2011_GWC1_33_32]KKP52363.1 MAG: hypothetical protein UR44_C0003G0145 [Candidatus Woesebacteria bacterium GW2011_GWB1_33_38]